MIVDRAAMIAGLTILGVVILNVLIYLAGRNGAFSRLSGTINQVAEQTKDPWEKQISSLSELHQPQKTDLDVKSGLAREEKADQ